MEIYISITLPLVHKTLWSVETIEYLILYIATFELVTSYPEKFSKKFKLIPVKHTTSIYWDFWIWDKWITTQISCISSKSYLVFKQWNIIKRWYISIGSNFMTLISSSNFTKDWVRNTKNLPGSQFETLG